MPKTTKRAATKRAARVARAHATDLPKLEVKEPQRSRNVPGYVGSSQAYAGCQSLADTRGTDGDAVDNAFALFVGSK